MLLEVKPKATRQFPQVTINGIFQACFLTNPSRIELTRVDNLLTFGLKGRKHVLVVTHLHAAAPVCPNDGDPTPLDPVDMSLPGSLAGNVI